MDIKTLKNFITVAESGSILKAANTLHISQPPLSKQMQALEKELNVTLFIRTPRGIRLTEKGELLYKKALSLVSYSESIVSELQEPEADIINIGLITSSTQYALPLLCEFASSRNVTFNIVERDSFEHIKMLENGLLDLTMVREPFDISDDITAIKLFDDALYAVCSPSLLNSSEEKIKLKDVAEMPLIVNRRWYNHINLYMDDAHKMHFKYICEDNRTATSLAVQGMGIAIVPGSVADAYVPKDKYTIRLIDDEKMTTDMYLLYSKKFVNSVSVRQFINYVIKKNTSEQI